MYSLKNHTETNRLTFFLTVKFTVATAQQMFENSTRQANWNLKTSLIAWHRGGNVLDAVSGLPALETARQVTCWARAKALAQQVTCRTVSRAANLTCGLLFQLAGSLPMCFLN